MTKGQCLHKFVLHVSRCWDEWQFDLQCRGVFAKLGATCDQAIRKACGHTQDHRVCTCPTEGSQACHGGHEKVAQNACCVTECAMFCSNHNGLFDCRDPQRRCMAICVGGIPGLRINVDLLKYMGASPRLLQFWKFGRPLEFISALLSVQHSNHPS